MSFVHLHVHSHYSLLDGLSKTIELVTRIKELGMNACALTDHGSMYGAVEFYKKAKALGVKPILGSEVYLTAGQMTDRNPTDKRYHLVLLVKNQTGYKNLVKLVSAGHLQGFYYKPRIDKEILKKHSQGLIALSGCLQGEINQAVLANNLDHAEELVQEYKEIFGSDFYLEISHHPGIPQQEKVNQTLKIFAKKFDIGLVATNDCHYIKKEDSEAQDILMAVQTGSRLGEGDRLTLKADDFSIRSPEEMQESFTDTPEAIKNTIKISQECNFNFNLGNVQLPHFEVPKDHDANSYLKELCYQNLSTRYQNIKDKAVLDRLEYELGVIEKTGFASYFLIVQDFVNWAKSQDIVVGPGRGSAAGSIVSYLLNITNIDPLAYDLLFERFLNPDRIAMPDIDIDFTDTRRDEVIEYVSEKYGRDRVAQIITFGTMAARAAVRDTGRALGYEYAFCDQIAKLIPFNRKLDEALTQVPELKTLYESNPEAKRLMDSAKKLEGVARHASTHACGVVITKEPLTNLVPLQYAARGNIGGGEKSIVTQYEFRAIEDLGLLKIDFLGLRNLTTIEQTLKILKAARNIDIDIEKIPLDDKKVFELLQAGKTTGVFQLEGAGMTRYLTELKPNQFEDIIAMISLYRPGTLDSGMVPHYIARKLGREKVTYLHPKLEPILKKTYGIGLYQEQMMRIARDLAGFTLAEADTLRKAISKKIKSLLDKQKEQLIKGMINNDIDKKTAQKIWELFPPFARYGFNRSHGAAYAMIGYQTAYLKARYPVEFMAALMNSEGFEVERVAKLVSACRQMDINVLPPDVNESFKHFGVVLNKSLIRFGLAAIKNVGINVAEAIIEARKQKGAFSDIADFMERVGHKDLNKKSLESLIRCGAFDSLGERNLLLTNLDRLLNLARHSIRNGLNGQNTLFSGESKLSLPKLQAAKNPADQKEKLTWEKELLGLYITDHPFRAFAKKINGKATPIKEITQNYIGKLIKVGGIISKIQKILTRSGQPMLFVELEDLNKRIEIVVFTNILTKNPDVWQEEKAVLIKGKVNDRGGSLKVLCDEAVEIA